MSNNTPTVLHSHCLPTTAVHLATDGADSLVITDLVHLTVIYFVVVKIITMFSFNCWCKL